MVVSYLSDPKEVGTTGSVRSTSLPTTRENSWEKMPMTFDDHFEKPNSKKMERASRDANVYVFQNTRCVDYVIYVSLTAHGR
jgi:hypothetical protein